MALQTNSFKISRYILMALVLILCIWIITWILINQKQQNQNTDKIVNDSIIQTSQL